MDKVSVITRPGDRKKAEEVAQMQKDNLAVDLKEQMKTKQGRWFVWHILKKLSYGMPITDINAKVYGAVAKQEVAIDITKELKAASRELFYLMETENEGA